MVPAAFALLGFLGVSGSGFGLSFVPCVVWVLLWLLCFLGSSVLGGSLGCVVCFSSFRFSWSPWSPRSFPSLWFSVAWPSLLFGFVLAFSWFPGLLGCFGCLGSLVFRWFFPSFSRFLWSFGLLPVDVAIS